MFRRKRRVTTTIPFSRSIGPPETRREKSAQEPLLETPETFLFPREQEGLTRLEVNEIIPDLKSIRNVVLTSESFHFVDSRVGLMNRTYFIRPRSPNDRHGYVVKVERMFKRPQDEKPLSRWTYYNQVLNARPDLTLNTPDLTARRKEHLETKHRLAKAGIETTNYIGSIVINGYNRETYDKIQELSGDNEAAKEELGEAFYSTPMYAEIWEDPGGVPTGSQKAAEERIEELYKSSEGRKSLEKTARGLLKLANEGFSIDVLIGGEQGLEVVPRTSSTEPKPYPKNFLITEDDRLVAFDFNVSRDLKSILSDYWPTDFTQTYFRSPTDGKLYADFRQQRYLEEAIRNYCDNQQQLSDIQRDELKDVLYFELERVFTQIQLGLDILQELGLSPNET